MFDFSDVMAAQRKGRSASIGAFDTARDPLDGDDGGDEEAGGPRLVVTVTRSAAIPAAGRRKRGAQSAVVAPRADRYSSYSPRRHASLDEEEETDDGT